MATFRKNSSSGAWNKIQFKKSPIQNVLDKHQTSKPVMVSCEFNSHWRHFYFLLKPFKTPQCLFCTEMSNLCYLRKPRLKVICRQNQLNSRFCQFSSLETTKKNTEKIRTIIISCISSKNIHHCGVIYKQVNICTYSVSGNRKHNTLNKVTQTWHLLSLFFFCII